MNIKYQVYDLQLRVDALELLLIEGGTTDKEKIKVCRKRAEENEGKRREEFQQEQWAKIKIGSVIEYELTSTSRLVLEVIAISPEPFQFLAGKIINKDGRSSYRKGEIYTTSWLGKILLRTSLGHFERLSR